MKIPTVAMEGNLRFTESGQVWADFVLQGTTYGLRPPKEKEKDRLLHQALYRALPGESLLLGLSSGLDPEQLVDQMLHEVDLTNCPDWVAECEATRDSLEQLRPGQRIFWLSLPLASDDPRHEWWMKVKAGFSSIETMLGLPPRRPEPETVKHYLAKSQSVQQGIPVAFSPRPATPAQMVWLHQHMIDRGLYLDEILPLPHSSVLLPSKSKSALDTPLLDEGGRTDLRKGAVVAPLKRRFLKVQSPRPGEEDEASYQSMLMLSDVPDGEIPFPGAELLGRIDASGLPVDWAMRLTVRAARDVLRKNQRALETLNEQFNQREGELSHGLGVLDRSAEDLSEYASILESDKLEVETQATIILSVSGDSAEAATTQAKALTGWVSDLGYKLAAPLGFQEEMWWQMHPGVVSSPLTREFAQITTSAALSTMVPLATDQVGDDAGILVGLNINNGPFLDVDVPCGPTTPVLFNPDGATDRNVAGSIAFVGDLGSGKSFALKKIAGAIVDRLGRIIVSDRTNMGEWALWASSLSDPSIVDVSSPQWSLDPLRVFAGQKIASRLAQSFLTPLLNVSPTSERGILLSEVLEHSYLTTHDIGGLGELIGHLETVDLPGAADLARAMKSVARQDIGRVVFDATLPPLELQNRVIVFRTHLLQLPTRADLDHEHLFRQLTIEKIFGRALFALITGLAKQVCFADRDELAAFVVDEAHAVTISNEGVAEIKDFVRDGRKHRACVLLGSHDPDEDFPSETMRGLIPYRVLMRHTDRTLARNGLRWLDQDPDDEALVELITKDTSPELGGEVPEYRRGECLWRDSRGNVGRVKILAPALRKRNQAARTGGRKDIAA